VPGWLSLVRAPGS